MNLTLIDLMELRDEAVIVHRGWKRRSRTLDSIAADDWQIVWDDLTTEAGEPLVENSVLQALEDKTAEAASVLPKIQVFPTLGTRKDRAEGVAQTRQRAFKSYWDRSLMDQNLVQLYFDWWGHAAAYLMPWCDVYNSDWTMKPSDERFPYMMRINPREVFPVSHSTTGDLAQAIVTKTRRWVDIAREYGADHPALLELESRWLGLHYSRERLRQVEESWYFDDTHWAVAISARPIPAAYENWRYIVPVESKNRIDGWLVPPTVHGLHASPLVEAKKVTNDGEYRSPLDSVIPRLKVAQNFMARFLEDVADSVFSPVLMENIINPEDYGPNAELIGDGQGKAQITYPRKPVNFEARQVILDQMAMARRQARFPEQRSGEQSGGWTTGRGNQMLMGAYNAEMRLAHSDISNLVSKALSRCAEYDEVHGAGRKTIWGYEGSAPWVETYDPATLFKGDYRNVVSYGLAAGMDKHNLLSTMALARNMQATSRRTFMQQTGIVDDALQEERDIVLEDAAQSLIGFVMAQAQAGNKQPLQTLVEKIDDDTKTVRQAIVETIQEMEAVPAEGPAAQGGVPPDPLRQVNSIEAGGNGVEGGLSDVGARLRKVLPGGVNRALAQGAQPK